MRLTQLFVRRPTLVTVLLALVTLAGAIAFAGLVQQNFPNIDFPVVQVRLTYAGASTTEIRDAIVKPIEDAIAGAPDLDYLNTNIQQGQATVTATFNLGSNQTSDLVEVQRRVQSTRAILPTDLTSPSIGTFDPAQTVVATLSVSSATLAPATLSALVTNNIVPELEQVQGVSNVNAGGTVTPAIVVAVDPKKIDAANFTLGDVVQAIGNNNVRAPGGIAYAPNRETTIDVRGDVTDPATVAALPLFAAAAGNTGGANLSGPQGGTNLQSPANGGTAGTTAATSTATAGTRSSGTTAGGTGSNATATATSNTGNASGSGSQTLSTSTTQTGSGTSASATNSSATNASAATATQNTASAQNGSVTSNAATVTAGNASPQPAPGAAAAANATVGTGVVATTTGGASSGNASGNAASGNVSSDSVSSGSASSTAVNPLVVQSSPPLPDAAAAAYGASQTSAQNSSNSSGASSTGVSSSPNANGSASSGSSGSSGTGAGGSTNGSGTSSSGSTTGSAATANSLLASLNPWSVTTRAYRISDIAHVFAGYEPRRVFAYVGPGPAISLMVQKATGASEIAASQNVLAALPRLRAEYPAVALNVLNVQADFTQQQLNSVYRSLAEGILFTGIVMLFFLRSWRNAIVILVAIPTSLLVTLFVMRLANFTIDTISLLAMTLIIGILVDDSIVVLENIERHYDDGEASQTAAILGRSEMGAAAIVITLVDVVVFLPIAFLPGTVGRFLAEFGLVVVVATLTSLFVSFTVTPALAGNWSLLSKWKPPFFIDAFTRFFDAVRRFYITHALEWALAHPWVVALVSFALTAGAISLVPLGYVGFEFIPAVDRGEVFVQLTFPTGSPLTRTNAAIADLSSRISKFPDVKRLTATAGSYQSGFGGGLTQGSAGQIHVFLVDKPKRTTLQWVTMLNRMAQRSYPEAKPIAIPATGTGGGNAQPIDYNIISADDMPEKYAPRILQTLKATPGTLNANSSAANLDPQVDVVFDRERGRALNTDIATAANAVRASFGGTLAAQFETNRGTQYVQVIYPQSAQTSVLTIPRIPLRTRAGALGYVGDVARLRQNPSSPLMSRVNRQTVIHLSANVEPGAALSNVQKTFLTRVAALHLPAGVRVVPNAGGSAQNLSDTVSGLGYSLVLSFTLVFLLMVALYDSYRLPFIIMFAIPVAAVGAVGSLALTGQSLNLFSLIGTVLLVGLVSKNGILLVDFANHRIRSGVDRHTAIRESANERFRPIIMTTFSMIAGMTPIALALDPGSSVRRSLGIVVIGGLTSSLLLTLVLVPIAFVWFAPRHPQPEPPKGDVQRLAAVAETQAHA